VGKVGRGSGSVFVLFGLCERILDAINRLPPAA